MAHAWPIDSNVKTSLGYSQEIPVSHSASQYQMWPCTSTFGSDMPYSRQTTASELNLRNGLAFPLSPPDHYNPYNTFKSVANDLYYNRCRPASMSMYKPCSAGSMDTLVATSPADVFNPTELPWTEANPCLAQNSGTDSTCSPNHDYVLSPESSAGFDAYNMFNHDAPSKMPSRSFSVASDDTVTPSLNSGAAPLALVAPLSDIESCLFGEIAPTHVKTEDLVVDLVDSAAPIAIAEEARAPLQEGEGRKHLGKKRTHDEVR